jgi:hypothetical protein
MKLVKTLDAIKINDEIKDIIMIASPIIFDGSSLNTKFSIGKATLFNLMSSPTSHLLTPDHMLEPENNASSTFAPPVFIVIDSSLATPPISTDFNAQNILLKGSSHICKLY